MITRRPLAALGFVLPALIIYGVLVLVPLVRGLWLSLTDSEGGPRASFIGLDNYGRLLADPAFMAATFTTLKYMVIVVVFQNLFGILLARALYVRPRVRKVLWVLILLPTLVAPLMAAYIFSYLLAPDGPFNEILTMVGLETLSRVWLGDPSTALAAVALVNIWMFAGYSATIFLAGYLAMPQDLIDAASIDGAGGWSRFRTVEWPLLAPALTVSVTLTLIGSLRAFEFPLILTNGGPAGTTTTLTMLIYQKTFLAPGQFAFGIAIAFALLLLVVVFAGVGSMVLRRREEFM